MFSLFRALLEGKGLWDEEQENATKKSAMKDIMEAFGRAEKAKKPPIDVMFNDVYDEQPMRLRKQQQELMEHLQKYPNEYPTGNFKS